MEIEANERMFKAPVCCSRVAAQIDICRRHWRIYPLRACDGFTVGHEASDTAQLSEPVGF